MFLAAWERVHEVDPDRPVILASADHDLSRLACGTRTQEQLRSAFAFLLTWGSVPSVYYGDEIGMRYLPGLPDVEGAICNPAYNRAGCRTPMQWDDGANAGFSTAEADALYLPIDPDPERPTVADQLLDPGSTLHLVRTLIALRGLIPRSAAGRRARCSTRAIRSPTCAAARTSWSSIRDGRGLGRHRSHAGAQLLLGEGAG